MHWPKSKVRRPVDFDLGGGAQSSSSRHIASKRIALRRRSNKCRSSKNFVTGGNEKADELATDGVILEVGEMAQFRASTVPANKRGGLRGTAVHSWLVPAQVPTLVLCNRAHLYITNISKTYQKYATVPQTII